MSAAAGERGGFAIEIFTRLEDVPRGAGSFLAIGTFDGVHRGHRALLGRLVRTAHQAGAPALALTFDRHPLRLLRPAEAPPALLVEEQKRRLIAASGVDALLVLRFDRALAETPAERFVEQVLCGSLGVRHLFVGFNFTFGRGGAGDASLLERLAGRLGFLVEVVAPVYAEGELVSSSRIRRAVEAGEMRRAAALLGHPFGLAGRVLHGDEIGRGLGFPTANLAFPEGLACPPAGVYLVSARLEDAPAGSYAAAGARLPGDDVGGIWPGVANLGRRPTVGGSDLRLEVHLLGFQGDLYGRCLSVALLDFLRPEQRFAGLDALRRQIERDVEEARQRLAEFTWPQPV